MNTLRASKDPATGAGSRMSTYCSARLRRHSATVSSTCLRMAYLSLLERRAAA